MLYSLIISGVLLVFMNVLFYLENILTYDGRLSGIFLSPNHLAMALVPGILALIVLIRRGVTGNEKLETNITCSLATRYSLLITGLLELIILYFTYSYGAWLALIAAAGLIIFIEKGQAAFSKKSLPYYLITALILGLLCISQLNNPKLQHILSGDYYSSLHSRLMIWQSALLISQDHWLTGVGADNFQQAYLSYQSRFSEPYLEWSAPQPHNIFLGFQTQLGVLGLIGFISIIFFTTRSVKAHKYDLLTLWALAYLVYFVTHGLIDTPYMKNDLAILFWLALATIWAAKSTHTAGYESRDL